MTRRIPLIGLAAVLALAGCGKADTSTNVADANNSAGKALENSAAELEATTDSLVDSEIANIDAEANAQGALTTNAANATNASDVKR